MDLGSVISESGSMVQISLVGAKGKGKEEG